MNCTGVILITFLDEFSHFKIYLILTMPEYAGIILPDNVVATVGGLCSGGSVGLSLNVTSVAGPSVTSTLWTALISYLTK